MCKLANFLIPTWYPFCFEEKLSIPIEGQMSTELLTPLTAKKGSAIALQCASRQAKQVLTL